MEIREATENQKDKWNSFVAESPYGTILQSYEWGDIKENKAWQTIRLTLWHKDRLVGVAQILKRSLPFHLQLFYSPFGPVFDWEMPYAEEGLQLIKKYLTDNADNRFLFWKIEPYISIEQAKNFKVLEVLKRSGFKYVRPSIQPQHTVIIDLHKSEKDLLASFEKDTRYSIRRAEREEVTVKEFKNPLNNQPIKEFYDLYTLTAKRGQFPPRPIEQMNKIWETMSPHQVRCFEAWYQDKLLSSAIVFTLGKKAFLVYAGSVREDLYKNKFPNYIMQWQIMKTLQEEGFISYDLWGVSPKEAQHHSWNGISLFKRGFRGQEITQVGSFDLPLSPLYSVYTVLNKLRYFFHSRGL